MIWFYKNQWVSLNNEGIGMIIKSRSINDTARRRYKYKNKRTDKRKALRDHTFYSNSFWWAASQFSVQCRLTKKIASQVNLMLPQNFQPMFQEYLTVSQYLPCPRWVISLTLRVDIHLFSTLFTYHADKQEMIRIFFPNPWYSFIKY